MTDEQINQRIAEACGWTEVKKDFECILGWPPNTSDLYCRVPNYAGCLNAMHEAEKTLGQALHCRYIDKLCDQAIKGNNCVYFATAAQRAEAFLRTIKKWEGEA